MLKTCPTCGSPLAEAGAACTTCLDAPSSRTTAAPHAGRHTARGMQVAVLSPQSWSTGLLMLASNSALARQHEWEAAATRVDHDVDHDTASPAPGQDPSTAEAGAGGPADPDQPPALTAQPSIPARGGPRVRLRVVLAAAAVVALLTVAASFLAWPRPQGAVAQRPTPTATATQSPTPMPTPTPGVVLLPGFALYRDAASGYALQYPKTWPTPSTDPSLGVQFSDASNLDSARYVVQVNQPDPLTSGVATGPDPNTAAANWVNFELTNFEQTEEAHGFTFARQPGPIPSILIGGQQWQAAAAVISGQDLSLQLRVFATIHNGKPYVINLLAASDVFASGQQTYFTPMLASFQFATPGS